MLHIPYYNPDKSYLENFNDGPFGAFADGEICENFGKPEFSFLGQKIFTPFGIPAGPLINGKFVKAALNKGFNIVTYKTVRSREFPAHAWPNIVPVNSQVNLTLDEASKGLTTKEVFEEPLSITNSFGVPSFNPDFWQKDLAAAVEYTQSGSVVIGAFQGTSIEDFVTTARLVKETGAKILEVNLSCPNEGAGSLLCYDAPKSKLVVDAIKNEIGNTPLIIKLAYFENELQLEKLITYVGRSCNAVAAINTIHSKVIYPNGEQALPGGTGRLHSGVGGSAIRWAGLDMVQRLSELKDKLKLNFTIIGVGGLMNPTDYKTYINKGADAALSATGCMWNPYLAQEIKDSLNK